MKLEIVTAAIIATTLVLPALAQDKPTTPAPKADAPKSERNKPSKRHSHLEERHGIKTADQPVSESRPVDKSKHSHPRDR